MPHLRKTLFVVLLAALLIPGLAFAAPRTNVSAASVSWQAAPEYDSVTLVVSGPSGAYYTREFKGGQAPSFSLKDLPANLALDGTYTFELRYTPRLAADVKQALADARERGDDGAATSILKNAGAGDGLVQSGAFAVLGGSFVTSTEGQRAPKTNTAGGLRGGSDAKLHAATDDQVIADDLIVQGSTCVGLDCVVNESFGFDTIRLKENNTRIKFDDTSTTSGCPNNDWQLTANDACGGANKFSIEDITGSKVPFTLTAGAPTNSMFIDSTGRLGLRTSSPVLDIHVSTSNTPAMRLEQTNAGGFTAQTWDVAGNEANFFVRDVTGGSRLPFRIRPGAPTSSIDIAASGRVGIGTASPETNVHVFSTSTTDAFVALGEDPDGSTGTQSSFNIGYGGSSLGRGTGFLNVRPDSNAVAPNPSIRFLTANVTRMIIDNEGFVGLSVANPAFPIEHSSGAHLTVGGVWTDASSRSFKNDIRNLETAAATETLKNLQPVTYTYKVDPKEHHVGFIAEDVPALVATPDRKSLSPMDIIAVLTKVVQDQQNTIDNLKTRLDQIEKKQ